MTDGERHVTPSFRALLLTALGGAYSLIGLLVMVAIVMSNLHSGDRGLDTYRTHRLVEMNWVWAGFWVLAAIFGGALCVVSLFLVKERRKLRDRKHGEPHYGQPAVRADGLRSPQDLALDRDLMRSPELIRRWTTGVVTLYALTLGVAFLLTELLLTPFPIETLRKGRTIFLPVEAHLIALSSVVMLAGAVAWFASRHWRKWPNRMGGDWLGVAGITFAASAANPFLLALTPIGWIVFDLVVALPMVIFIGLVVNLAWWLNGIWMRMNADA